MKNLVYALVGAGFMIACQPSSRPEISGTLTGIESDTLLVQSFPVNDRDSRRTDTVAMQNGRSEERRVGKECTSWCRSRWSPYH